MNILLLSYSDAGGGAAIAALRLTESLRNRGDNAVLGVIEKRTAFNYVITVPARNTIIQKIYRKLARRLESFLFKHFRSQNTNMHSINIYSKIDIRWINKSNYDIVHLNWINNNMISISDIGKIKKPIVWTMHDSWPVCGAEHHPDIINGDDRYQTGYEIFDSSARGFFDLSRITFQRKKNNWKNLQINFVAPSNWEGKIAINSKLFTSNPKWSIKIIPNIVDSGVFTPIKKNIAREAIGINKDAIVVGFGSAYKISKEANYKGTHLIEAAIKEISNKYNNRNIILLAFGPMTQDFLNSIDGKCIIAGTVTNEAILNLLYNCCDVYLCPSMIESFGLTVLEAQLANIPVVAFGATGIIDIIENKITGYLAEPYNPIDLGNGIDWCINNKTVISDYPRKKALEKFNINTIVDLHHIYYLEILRRQAK